MTRPSAPQYDLGWRRANVSAMIALCALAGALLVGRALWRPMRFDDTLPVDPARVAAARERIDPNTASVASLRRLHRIGPKLAAAIVAYRQSSGPNAFRIAKDLDDKIHGIGPTILRRNRDDLALPTQ